MSGRLGIRKHRGDRFRGGEWWRVSFTLVTPVIMFSTMDLTVRKHATCFRPPCQIVKTIFWVLAVLTCRLVYAKHSSRRVS